MEFRTVFVAHASAGCSENIKKGEINAVFDNTTGGGDPQRESAPGPLFLQSSRKSSSPPASDAPHISICRA